LSKFRGVPGKLITLYTALYRLDEGMAIIRTYIPNIGDDRVEAWCDDFLNYVQQFWLDGQFPRFSSKLSMKPISTTPRAEWNHWDRMDDNHATNNICEGENNRLISR
jgi:hypothetical protein